MAIAPPSSRRPSSSPRNLLDGETLRRVLREQAIEAVMHMAAYALVGESYAPGEVYQNNLVAGLSLLNAMNECGVKRLVFSSTCATYGETGESSSRRSCSYQPTNSLRRVQTGFRTRRCVCMKPLYGLRVTRLFAISTPGRAQLSVAEMA